MNDLDAMAREQGFPDYASMQAWMRHRSESLTRNTTTVRPGTQGNPSPTQAPAPAPAPKPSPTLGGVWGAITRALGY